MRKWQKIGNHHWIARHLYLIDIEVRRSKKILCILNEGAMVFRDVFYDADLRKIKNFAIEWVYEESQDHNIKAKNLHKSFLRQLEAERNYKNRLHK